MSKLNEIIEKWKKEAFSNVEIEKLLSTLKKVYIGQHIREEGILQFEFENEKKQIQKLLKDKLIRENKWYRHKLFLTTQEGSEIAQEIVEKELKEKHKSLLTIVSEIPHNLFSFLIFEYFTKQLQFICGKEYFFDWRDPLFKDSRILICRNKILKRLEELGFSIKTYMYVSTGGGKLRELYYVISPEIQKKLSQLTSPLHEIDTIKKKLVIYFFLVDRILPFVKPPEEKNEDIISMYRQEFWNRLEDLNLKEEEIKPIINELAEKNVTTDYKGLLVKDLPFEVKDEIAYKKLLKEKFVEPIILYLLEEKDISPELKHKEPEREKLPPGIVSEREIFKFFLELGDFENKVRKFIASKLGENLENANRKREGVKNLISRLKEWRSEEKHLVGVAREPLINYATFGDYITLITSHWEVFQEYFTSQEEATIPLTLINIFARRPLAHFRTLTKERIQRAREEIKRFLTKIEVNK